MPGRPRLRSEPPLGCWSGLARAAGGSDSAAARPLPPSWAWAAPPAPRAPAPPAPGNAVASDPRSPRARRRPSQDPGSARDGPRQGWLSIRYVPALRRHYGGKAKPYVLGKTVLKLMTLHLSKREIVVTLQRPHEPAQCLLSVKGHCSPWATPMMPDRSSCLLEQPGSL
ncbi:cortexin domain-containing 1 protein isoform X1 [Pan paniscus]|uniref:cortexin domain-containing 1 protein isoform X1 n=1 Tax=Pan paniscus TaxID=9597 RepID=UPI003007D66F